MMYLTVTSFLTLARWIIAAIFLTSSLPKLRHPRSFTSAIAAYHLLPQRWVDPFATTLPWLELALGLMLLLGWGTRIAAVVSAALLIVFLAAMGINLARGRKDLDCGCSGKHHSQKIGWKTITRNVILLLLSAQAIYPRPYPIWPVRMPLENSEIEEKLITPEKIDFAPTPGAMFPTPYGHILYWISQNVLFTLVIEHDRNRDAVVEITKALIKI